MRSWTCGNRNGGTICRERVGRNRMDHRSRLLHPGRYHLTVLIGLWEHSVRLNVASAILRQALMASVTSSLDPDHQNANAPLDFDITTIQQALSPNLRGLSSSVEGAFGTLRHLVNFPTDDLRRAPDV